MAIELEEEKIEIPEWVVTFGDMMSLLLTFFIMLVSMSEVRSEEKFQAMAESLRKRFGHESSIWNITPGPAKPRNARFEKRVTLGRAKRADTMRGGGKLRAPIGKHHRVRTMRRGDQVTYGGTLYFERGSGGLNDEHRGRLRKIVERIGGKPQKIELRGYASRSATTGNNNGDNGHDDNTSSHSRLAYQRCRQTMQYLVQSGIQRERIRLGINDPGGDTTLGNKDLTPREFDRVEIVMINELTSELVGTMEEQRNRFSHQDDETKKP